MYALSFGLKAESDRDGAAAGKDDGSADTCFLTPKPVIDDKQRSREAEGRHPNEKTPFDAEEEKRRKRTVGDVREKRARQEIGRAGSEDTGSEDTGSEDAGAKPFLLSGLVSMKPLLLRKEKWSDCLVLCADPRQVGPSDGGKGLSRKAALFACFCLLSLAFAWIAERNSKIKICLSIFP